MPPQHPSSPPLAAPKSVFLVDDHPVFLEGLSSILSQVPGLLICGKADCAPQALDEILRLSPDLVLMDISLPGKSGLELLQELIAHAPLSAVLVISMHDETLYAERVLRAGGRGYVMKQEDPEKILAAITTVLSGQVYASPRTAASILESLSRPRSAPLSSLLTKLTARELEILRLTGQGKDNRRIAEELSISLKTADTHRAHIKEKLGFKNSTEFVHYAVRWVGDQV